MRAPAMRRSVATHTLLAATLCAQLASAQVVNLNTGFMPDPRRMQGMAGGPVSAQTVQQDCRGFIGSEPNVVLTSPTGFRFLRVFAESQQDVTLMVRGVQGTWCADDTYGTNPGVDLRGLPPGRYDIYVGTYASGQSAPFSLAITELQSQVPGGSTIQPTIRPQPQPGGAPDYGQLDPTARPTGRAINVPPLPRRPIAVTGRTNGEFDASRIRGEGTCRGWVQAAPSHMMFLRTRMPFLSVFVLSAADSTLIIRRPDGTLVCNDDRFGLNPGVQGTFEPGLYQVWVGTYRQGENRPYRITATIDPSQHP